MSGPNLRSALRTALHYAGVLGLVRDVRNRLWARQFAEGNRAFLKNGPPDGLPIPPVSLRILVAASPDIPWFFESGRRGADTIRGVLEKNGIALQSVLPLLDFGCGCGRTLRHLADVGDQVYGTDQDDRLVRWCRDSLPYGHYEVNALNPPLPFADATFGLVYAFSVFTHLPADLQALWMNELKRIVRPGGCVIFTTHGARYISELAPADRNRFLAGELVVKRDDSPGSNFCGAYHPEGWVRRQLTAGFDVIDFVPEGAAGNPWQDLWLLRRR